MPALSGRKRNPCLRKGLAALFHLHPSTPRDMRFTTCCPALASAAGSGFGEHCCSALALLQGLPDSESVQSLVAALTYHVRQCREELTLSQLNIALTGLEGLSDSAQTRQLISALT